MDQLPREILELILFYIDVPGLFLSVSLTCKVFKATCSTDYFLSQVLKGQINTDLKVTLPSNYCTSVIKEIYLQEPLSKIRFSGFGTTGGIDGFLPYYWVNNLFNYDASAYCSNLSTNINCVAVLKSGLEVDSDSEFKYMEKALEILRFYRDKVDGVEVQESASELMPKEAYFFMSLWENRESLKIVDGEPFDFDEFEKVYKSVAKNRFALDTFSVFDDKNVILQRVDIGKDLGLACVREVEISREGEYSCPLCTFLVFISDDYCDITGADLQVYNNLYTSADISRLLETDHNLPKAEALISGKSFEYRLFQRTSAKLKPILWGKFKSPSKLSASIRLDEVFSGRFLYAKLINSDNLMRQFQDDSLIPNIDCTYIGVRGLEIRIS